MSEPTNKTYEIDTLNDLLQLEDERQLDDCLKSIKKAVKVTKPMYEMAKKIGLQSPMISGFKWKDDGIDESRVTVGVKNDEKI